MIDESIKTHATLTQIKYIDAVNKYGSRIKAAAALGVHRTTIGEAISTARKNASPKANERTGEKWIVIPDPQCRPGVDLGYMYCIGRYIADKKPDGVICLGDLADMESLCSYDKGKKSFEGRRYKHDIGSAVLGQQLLWYPVHELNKSLPATAQYRPRTVFLNGNHEQRIDRAIESDAVLDGTINRDKDLQLNQFWDEVYEFNEVVVINGVAFSHYFGTGPMGRPCSTAVQQLRKMHMSSISGHQQGRQTHVERAADGRQLMSIIAGSSYDYAAEYLGPQGNKHWRGIITLHSMQNGEFDEVYVPTSYLRQKYGAEIEPMYYDKKSG